MTFQDSQSSVPSPRTRGILIREVMSILPGFCKFQVRIGVQRVRPIKAADKSWERHKHLSSLEHVSIVELYLCLHSTSVAKRSHTETGSQTAISRHFLASLSLLIWALFYFELVGFSFFLTEMDRLTGAHFNSHTWMPSCFETEVSLVKSSRGVVNQYMRFKIFSIFWLWRVLLYRA